MKTLLTSFLLMTVFFSCTKTNLTQEIIQEEIHVISIEIVDLSVDRNTLNSPVKPTEYNLAQTLKVVNINGLIEYHSSNIKNPTKIWSRWTIDNKKFVEAICTDSLISAGVRYFSINDLNGGKYYSHNIRTRDMAIANPILVKELPLYTLKPISFTPGGVPEQPGKLFSCLKSRINACSVSWRCGMYCTNVISGVLSVFNCSLGMVRSCFPF